MQRLGIVYLCANRTANAESKDAIDRRNGEENMTIRQREREMKKKRERERLL